VQSCIHAGTYKQMSFEEANEALINELFNLNVKSIIYGTKYAMKAMKEKGTKGAIVVNSSGVSHVAKSSMAGSGVYASTKSAGDMLVQYAAIEGAENGTHPVCLYHLNWKALALLLC
jgi:NAD(P)-dependent dehydrogenase (short-subunit alcohol dehydrogenase family)